MYFYCDPAAIEHLKKDPRMSAVIDQVGAVQREVDPDLFSSVVHHIVGQQISTKAQATIWQRMRDALHNVDPDSVAICRRRKLQALGIMSARRNILWILPKRPQRQF